MSEQTSSTHEDETAQLRRELRHLHESHTAVCQLVARMHAAAMGRLGVAPLRGVIEDIDELRAVALSARDFAEGVVHNFEGVVHNFEGGAGLPKIDKLVEAARKLLAKLDAAAVGP